MANTTNTTNTTSYLDPPSLIGRQNSDGTISLTPLELKRLNDFNYAVSKMIQGGLNLANLNSATNKVITDLEGNVTSVSETAAGLSVSVSNLSGEVSTVSATVNGLDVTTSGGTTYISGDHIKTGTIEGVTLISQKSDGIATDLQSVTIEDGAITLKNSEGDTATISEAISGFNIAVSSAFSTGVTVTASHSNFNGDVNVLGDLNVAQNINSSGTMKLSAGGNASFDAGGTLYLQTNGGDINIGNGGNIRLNGTVTVNGVPYAPAGG